MIKVKVELKKGISFKLALGILFIIAGMSFGFMSYFFYPKGPIFILIFPSVVFTIVGLIVVFSSFHFSISKNIGMANKINKVSDVDIYDETGG